MRGLRAPEEPIGRRTLLALARSPNSRWLEHYLKESIALSIAFYNEINE